MAEQSDDGTACRPVPIYFEARSLSLWETFVLLGGQQGCTIIWKNLT
jgi:hypothetical protein